MLAALLVLSLCLFMAFTSSFAVASLHVRVNSTGGDWIRPDLPMNSLYPHQDDTVPTYLYRLESNSAIDLVREELESRGWKRAAVVEDERHSLSGGAISRYLSLDLSL